MQAETKKYFTSDLHIRHSKACEYTDRKLVTTQELHDEWLIEVINKDVRKGDLLYILGDVSFSSDVDYTAKILKAMNGQKIVIKGNHCRTKDLKELADANVIQAWYHYHEIKLKGNTTCLFHFPIMHWHKASYGSWHLHGHLHGNPSGVEGRILDVGIDNAYNIYGKHRCFSEDDIAEYMQGIEVKKHHI